MLDSCTKGNWRNEAMAYLFCVIAAAAVLLICSGNSFLYPMNPHIDVHCFMSMARGMLNDLVPYKELMEQKGPLLYELYALGLKICPDSYHGAYILEILFVSVGLYIAWKMMRLYIPELSVAWMALIGAVSTACYAMAHGGGAEEWCFPLIMASIYRILRYWRHGKAITMKEFVLHGFLAGCVLWIKFNQLGVHFVFMAMLAVEAVILDRSLVRALKMCCMFLLGMMLATVPWLIYFGVHGAIGEWIQVYLLDNIFGYTVKNVSVLKMTAYGVLEGMKKNPAMTVLLVIGMAGIIIMPFKRMAWPEKIFLAFAAGFTALAVYGGGRNYDYYFWAFVCFVPFGLLPLLPLGNLAKKTVHADGKMVAKTVDLILCMVLLIGSVAYAGVFYPYDNGRGLKIEDTPQGIIAAYINGYEDRTLLNFGALDLGVYFAADVLPENRYFCLLNNNKIRGYEDQLRTLEEGKVHFAVTRGIKMEDILQQLKDGNPDREYKPLNYEFVMESGGILLYQRLN